jgi:hypothetical protein
MGKPFPCCSCCKECDALFNLNWAMRLCIPPYFPMPSSRITPSDQADNAAYCAAITSAFSNVSISWASTTYTINGVNYDARVCSSILSGSYPIHTYKDSGVPGIFSTFNTTVTDTYLTVGAVWRPDLTGSSFPKKCTPQWFWNVIAKTTGGRTIAIALIRTGTGISVTNVDNIPFNADDYPYFKADAGISSDTWYSTNENQSTTAKCFNVGNNSLTNFNGRVAGTWQMNTTDFDQGRAVIDSPSTLISLNAHPG